MSLQRKIDADRIVEILSYVKSQVELYNPNNFTDINIYAENFYRDFLNLLFDYNLININILEPNSAAIDLGDENAKFAVQVTSTTGLDKVRNTVNKFNDKNLHEKYDRLVILNIVKKKKHVSQLIGDEKKYQLDTSTDIWDIATLLTIIGDLPAKQISVIREFLEQQVTLSFPETLPKEVITFQALIALLSDEVHPNAGKGFVEEPDPKGKIEERFSGHTEFLKKEFRDLYSEFGEVLNDVRSHADLGQVKMRRLRLHLKAYSDKILEDCRGNAKAALDELVKQFAAKLAGGKQEYDNSAIRFYLIDELIRCNVFPNKEAIGD